MFVDYILQIKKYILDKYVLKKSNVSSICILDIFVAFCERVFRGMKLLGHLVLSITPL